MAARMVASIDLQAREHAAGRLVSKEALARSATKILATLDQETAVWGPWSPPAMACYRVVELLGQIPEKHIAQPSQDDRSHTEPDWILGEDMRHLAVRAAATLVEHPELSTGDVRWLARWVPFLLEDEIIPRLAAHPRADRVTWDILSWRRTNPAPVVMGLTLRPRPWALHRRGETRNVRRQRPSADRNPAALAWMVDLAENLATQVSSANRFAGSRLEEYFLGTLSKGTATADLRICRVLSEIGAEGLATRLLEHPSIWLRLPREIHRSLLLHPVPHIRLAAIRALGQSVPIASGTAEQPVAPLPATHSR